MTKFKFYSDSKDDVGKSFGGIKIQSSKIHDKIIKKGRSKSRSSKVTSILKPTTANTSLINNTKLPTIKNKNETKNKTNSVASRNNSSILSLLRSNNDSKYANSVFNSINSTISSNKELKNKPYNSSSMNWGEKSSYFASQQPRTLKSGIKSGAYRVGSNLNPVNLYNSIKAFPSSVVKYVRSNNKREQFMNVGATIGKAYKTQDPRLLADIVTPKVPSTLISGTAKLKKTYDFAGRKETKATDYIDNKNLNNKDPFPNARSTENLDKSLKKANNQVVTSSPSKLKKKDKVADSNKSKNNYEDKGIYVAPKGKGNKYFLRLKNNSSNAKYSFNPVNLFEGIKREFSTPAITFFNTGGSVKIPKKVLNSKDPNAVNKFQESLANTGKVSHTRNTAQGFGNVKKRKNTHSTTEYEFVIPKGTNFTTANTKQFVKIDGQKVLIQKGILDSSKKYKTRKAQENYIRKRLESQYNNYKSSYNPSYKYKSPYKYGLYNYGSSKGISKPNYKPTYKGKSSYIKGSTPTYKPNYIPTYKPNYKSIYKSGGSSGSSSSSSGKSTASGYSPITTNTYPNSFTPTKPKKLKLDSSNKKKLQQKKYNIFIKKRGNWTQLNTQPLKFGTALSRSKSLVDNTLLRSAKISGQGLPSKLKLKKFTTKRTNNSILLTEKKKYTKDSKNEKQQLNRTKRYKKR